MDKNKPQKHREYDGTQVKKWRQEEAVTTWSESYARVDRRFTDIRSKKYWLSVNELYLFILISLDQRKDDSLFTNINSIEENMPIRFAKGVHKNREFIISALYGLKDKNIINIYGETNYKKPYQSFYIKINYKEYEEDKEGKDKRSGYNPVYFDILHKIKRIEHLYVYCSINGFEKTSVGYYTCSYSDWADSLNKSMSSVKRYIDEMAGIHDKGGQHTETTTEDKLIHVNYGDYREGDRNSQYKNMYRVTEFEDWEKTARTRQKEYDKKKAYTGKLAFGSRE